MATQSTSMKARGADAGKPRRYTLSERIKGYGAWLAVFPLYVFLWGFARVFKRVPTWLHRKLLREWEGHIASKRRPDVTIPAFGPTYMRRWHRIKRNAFFNIYYHHVLRSDEDAALHDHPWWNFSIVLENGYFEHCIAEGGVHHKTWYPAGSVRFRHSGCFTHRLELLNHGRHAEGELPVKTIFITGPVLRRWGFHHPMQWVDAYDWDDFTERYGIKTSKMKGYAEQHTKGTDQ